MKLPLENQGNRKSVKRKKAGRMSYSQAQSVPPGGENMYVIWSEGKPVTVVKAKRASTGTLGKLPGFGSDSVPPPGKQLIRTKSSPPKLGRISGKPK